MTTPLYPHLVPLTFTWGFLHTGLLQAREALLSWLLDFSPQVDIADMDSPLEEALVAMQPLTVPPSKRLLVATQSGWTACFDNGANGAELLSLMTVLTSRLKCDGLVIRCVTDKRMYSPPDQEDHFTHLGFEFFRPGVAPAIGPTRAVSLYQYYGKWKFRQGGEPLPAEDSAQYTARPIQRRLSLESIAGFCQSLGLSPFVQSFYLNRCCAASISGVSNYPVSRSLREAQAIFSQTSNSNTDTSL
jgi:hypothetical protein